MASSLIASQALLRPPILPHSSIAAVSSQSFNRRQPSPVHKPLFLRPRTLQSPNLGLRVSASASPSCSSAIVSHQSEEISIGSLLTGPTRILATVVSVSLTFSSLILKLIQNVWPTLLAGCFVSPSGLGAYNSVGSMFFAALRDRPSGYLNTPLTVVAAGLSKWLDIYSGVLMVRVLLSWFPNIPWERQPLSAIRDLCDPYLNLFRNIIPPIFDTLDVSPLLAFAVLGTLGSILNNSRGMY